MLKRRETPTRNGLEPKQAQLPCASSIDSPDWPEDEEESCIMSRLPPTSSRIVAITPSRLMHSPSSSLRKQLLYKTESNTNNKVRYRLDALHLLVCSIFVLSLAPFISLHYLPSSTSEDASSVPMSAADRETSTATSTTILAAPNYFLDDSLPLIHIVNSRFQQHAHNLSAIGAARLELFETFCLPSIIHQTIQPNVTKDDDDKSQKYRFLWILKIDPNLDITLRTRMIKLLKPYPNFFLVGSNNNFGASYGTGIEPGSWRGGHAGDDLLFGNVTSNLTGLALKTHGTTYIYTGDISMLQFAHAHRSDKIILETRVDADDGLPTHYLEEIQSSAIKHLSVDPNEDYDWPKSSADAENDDANMNTEMVDEEGNGQEAEQADDGNEEADDSQEDELVGKAKWLYWCIPHSISWHPTVLENGFVPHANLETDDPGRLTLDTNKGNIICMTPGLTSGMSVGIDDSEVPRYSHYDLLNQMKRFYRNPRNNCGVHELSTPCLQVLEEEAVRSRTPTSAGMKNVGIGKLNYTAEEIDAQWEYMLETFGVRRERAAAANKYIHTHLVSILQDNLNGQCSHGHSCKEKARQQLLSMIEAAKARDDLEKIKVATELLEIG